MRWTGLRLGYCGCATVTVSLSLCCGWGAVSVAVKRRNRHDTISQAQAYTSCTMRFHCSKFALARASAAANVAASRAERRRWRVRSQPSIAN